MNAFLQLASRADRLGIIATRVGLIIVLLWIGGLKVFKYEADGIVPFVANSPTMSFFYKYPAPDYKAHMNPEGKVVPANRDWHERNHTYTFSYGLGAVIVIYGLLLCLHPWLPQAAAVGGCWWPSCLWSRFHSSSPLRSHGCRRWETPNTDFLT